MVGAIEQKQVDHDAGSSCGIWQCSAHAVNARGGKPHQNTIAARVKMGLIVPCKPFPGRTMTSKPPYPNEPLPMLSVDPPRVPSFCQRTRQCSQIVADETASPFEAHCPYKCSLAPCFVQNAIWGTGILCAIALGKGVASVCEAVSLRSLLLDALLHFAQARHNCNKPKSASKPRMHHSANKNQSRPLQGP